MGAPEDFIKARPQLLAFFQRLRRWAGPFARHPLRSWLGYGRFFRDRGRYLQMGGRAPLGDSYPCLFDATSHTPFDSHYFYQAAWAMRKIAAKAPAGHVDVGSDLRFVGMVAALVDTTFIDIRPPQLALDRLTCRAGSVLKLPLADGSAASLSSLSVIEHIGLGRYGDPLLPRGTELAAQELCRVLAPGGDLLISLPVGAERECFNAHRIFDPLTVLSLFASLQLRDFSVVDDAGNYHAGVAPSAYRELSFGNGLFHFSRPA